SSTRPPLSEGGFSSALRCRFRELVKMSVVCRMLNLDFHFTVRPERSLPLASGVEGLSDSPSTPPLRGYAQDERVCSSRILVAVA
ncbi:MAG TPA: hypothetical protein VFJ01_08830, partial [Oleiagrimonas sp.]|nr:hypothetical protein [Oleiagrimonas sp.]